MPQDAITLLDEDHQRVELLFNEYQSSIADRSRKNDVAQIICMELTMHAQLEEELFYPAFAQATGANQVVQDAVAEHQQAKDLIARIQGNPDPDALMLELQRAVQLHVAEERARIFPRARSVGLDLAGLGAQLEARKTELVAALTHTA
jgi:hypothetical protein